MTTLLLIDYLENREKFNVIKSVLLGIFTVYIALFRLNGIMITAFVTVYMIITLLRNKKIKQMLAVIIPIVVIYSGIHYYAYDVLKTESPVNGFSMQQVISNISAAVEDNASDEEIAMVDEVTDVEFIKEHYTPWHGEKLIWAEDNHSFMTELGSNKKELILVYIKLIPKHFISMFKDIIHNTVIAWGHMDKKEYIWNNAYEWLAIFDNVSLMLIFASVIMSIKNRKRYMSKNVIIFMPILLNMLSIVMTTITNEQRYFLPTVTLFPILITYILCQVKQTAVESR
jgi:hypothetical protein